MKFAEMMEQREFLKGITRKCKESAKKINRARVLLLTDEGKKIRKYRN